MKIGLFFGSFNPIHIGHLMIANIALETTDIEEVWFVVSPHNPFKRNKNLLHEFDRYDMVQAAIADHPRFRVSDVEFNMPKPNYTVDTLAVIGDQHPNHDFSIIIGEDNLADLIKWKNYTILLDYYRLIVYPRPESKRSDLSDHPSVKFIEAPKIDISATLIRKMLKKGQSVRYMVPEAVIHRIGANKFYLD